MRKLAAWAWIAFTAVAVPAGAADSFSGEYSLSMPEVASGLLLKPDNTFQYFFTYGAADYTAKGTWASVAGAVLLTTDRNETPPFRLTKTAVGSSSEFRVHVQTKDGRGIEHISVSLATASGTVEAKTSGGGVAAMPRKGAPLSVSFHVPVYNIDAGPFPLPEPGNEVWFEINGESITTVRFHKEPLKAVGDGLEMTFWKTPKPLLYRKD